MPRLTALKVSALARIAAELRYAPTAAARRHVEAAEHLARIIDPAGSYPEDFIVFQITGYRPAAQSPEIVPGAALARDLPALIDRLCAGAEYTLAEFDRNEWLTIEDVMSRWNVTRKTIERSRAKGLCGRRVRIDTVGRGRGSARTLYARAAVEAFEHRHSITPAAPAAPPRKRLRADERATIIDTARTLRDQTGCSRSSAARIIARDLGRAHETIRQILIAHDQSRKTPIFADRPPTSPAQRELSDRAMRRGIAPRKIAARIGKSTATVHRAALQELADRCRSLRLVPPIETRSLVEGHADRWLKPASVRTKLGEPAAASLPEHVADALRAGWPDQHIERARLMAYWSLVARASSLAEKLHRTRPAAQTLDAIITDLRWAARLKAELVRGEQLLLLRTIEVQTGKPLLEHEPPDALKLLESSIAAVALAVDKHDPAKGGRLAAPAGLELSRVVSRWLVAHQSQRAKARPLAASLTLSDWTRSLCPWQPWTEPDPRIRARLPSLTTNERELLQARHGWSGAPPRSTAVLSTQLDISASTITRRLRTLENRAIHID